MTIPLVASLPAPQAVAAPSLAAPDPWETWTTTVRIATAAVGLVAVAGIWILGRGHRVGGAHAYDGGQRIGGVVAAIVCVVVASALTPLARGAEKGVMLRSRLGQLDGLRSWRTLRPLLLLAGGALVIAGGLGYSSWRFVGVLVFGLGPVAAAMAGAMGLIVAHLACSRSIVKELTRRYLEFVPEVLRHVGNAAADRVDALKHENFEYEMPDREQTATGIRSLVEFVASRVDEMMAQVLPLETDFGPAALLYHPDLLPHLSSLYLLSSQLRGLNVAPRRVQLLARYWNESGLVSEYVIMHDISDIRAGYPVAMADAADDKKWRLRSLKKRATVRVAADGTLLRIDIEEERQLNI